MMNGIRGLAIAAAVAAVVAAGIAGGAEATKQHFRFELLDGTVITGTMDAAALTVKTSYGTLKVPAADLVSFTPGLDSRPELAEKIDVLIRLLVSPEKEDREQAQAELIKLGPALRLIVERLARDEDPDPERKARIKAILDAYKAWPAKHPDARQPFVLPPEQKDKVATAKLSAAGRIANEQFTVAASYGTLTIKLSDIYRARKVEAWRPQPATEKAMPVIVCLRDGSRLKGTTRHSAIGLRTRWGRLNVPLGLISVVKFGNEPAATAVAFAGGDKLYGATVETATMTVKTTIGEMALPMDKIARLYVGPGLRPGQSVLLLKPDALTGKCKNIGRTNIIYNEERGLYQFWVLAKGGGKIGRYHARYEIYYGEFQDLVAPKVRDLQVVLSGRYANYETEGPATHTVLRDRLTGKYHIWAHSYYTRGWKCEIRHFTSDDGVKWAEQAKAHTARRLEDYQSPVAVQLSDGTIRLYYTHQSRDGQPNYLARSDIAPRGDKPGARTNTNVRPPWLRGAVAFTDRHHRVWYRQQTHIDTFDGGKTWSRPATRAAGPYGAASLAGVFYSKQSDAAVFIYRGKGGSLMLAADCTPVRR